MSQHPGNDKTTGNYQPQQPPAYPNQAQPPAYSASQPGYYTEQGAYAGYAQAYGQGLPAHMDAPERPQALKTASLIMYVMIGLGVLGSILSTIFYQEIQQATSNSILSLFSGLMSEEDLAAAEAEIAMTADTGFATAGLIVGLVFGLIWSALLVFFTIMMNKGHNWARIVLTVVASFQILNLLMGALTLLLVFHWIMLVDLLAGVLAIAFLVFVWKSPVSTYMRQIKAYQQWKLQQAYLGADRGQR
ncbi:hypothetical protein [Rothia nasimurium]|uniref:hypothetical protein n=1 Tax=Rothia nasimurium TaxID=85336 RepID=UPI0023512A6D|nr:hypothetical protein [Rothia nasimurium]